MQLEEPLHQPCTNAKAFAMPLCLLITVLISLVAIAAHQTALTGARMSSARINSHTAFNLAEYAINNALFLARTSPETLPTNSTPLDATLSLPQTVSQQVAAVITMTHQDSNCPEFNSGRRQHYEVLATVTFEQTGKRSYRQGFFICRQDCTFSNCSLEISAPRRTYWTISE
jgi:Tfp pilus assembly protein PilX